MNKKIIWGIVIVVILIGAGFLYSRLAAPRYANCCHGEQYENAPTSSWKTYSNNQYGFQVQYPSDWTFNENYTTSNIVSFSDPHTDGPVTNSFTIKKECSDVSTNGWVPMGEAYTKIMCVNGFSIQSVYSDIKTKDIEEKISLSFKLNN